MWLMLLHLFTFWFDLNTTDLVCFCSLDVSQLPLVQNQCLNEVCDSYYSLPPLVRPVLLFNCSVVHSMCPPVTRKLFLISVPVCQFLHVSVKPPSAEMAAGGNPGARMPDCMSKVSLSVSCQNLLDMDVFSKSDPLCVLLMNSSGPHWCEVSGKKGFISMYSTHIYPHLYNYTVKITLLHLHACADWLYNILCLYQIGRTEKIQNCLNPSFSKTFTVDYYFEMVQKLRFELYDIDSDTCSLQDADFLGELECTLGQVTGISNIHITHVSVCICVR